MTTIFTVSVDSVEGATLRGKVHVVNPDVPYVPDESVFPLSLLVDAWWHLDNGFLHSYEGGDDRERYPLSVEHGQATTAGMRLRGEYLKLYELILGKKIRVTEDGYLLGEDNQTVLEPKRKASDVHQLDGGSGYDGISHFAMTSGDADAFEDQAADIITAYDISDYRNVPLLSEVAAAENEPMDPQQTDGPADLDGGGAWNVLCDKGFPDMPYADITVTVSDAGYLEHLVAGMRWETTMTGHVC